MEFLQKSYGCEGIVSDVCHGDQSAETAGRQNGVADKVCCHSVLSWARKPPLFFETPGDSLEIPQQLSLSDACLRVLRPEALPGFPDCRQPFLCPQRPPDWKL